MSAQTDADPGPDGGSSRRGTAYRAAMTIAIVALAFAALWFVVNLIYALL